jgi:N-acetylglucosaminyl-diphospho-decaprenol L-rhamnosyltransferase
MQPNNHLNLIEDFCTVVIPTFFPGENIINSIKSVPKFYRILILDNSYDNRIFNLIKNFNNCLYYHLGDVGLPKTFNFALTKINTNFIFLMQPDVILRKDCLENLYKATKIYDKAAILAPIVYDDGDYSNYDFYDLNYSIRKKKFFKKKYFCKKRIKPSGDISVEAVNATSMLINTQFIKNIGGWDENIYLYLEDIDISLRFRLKGYEIIKVSNSEVDHEGFSSHLKSIKDEINLVRVWHFTWSSIYFRKKFSNFISGNIFLFKAFFIYFLKFFLNLLVLNKKKILINIIKISACLSILSKKGSYFRIKHKI